MLHVGVLPNHDRWGDVLANLRYVVIDEAHVYRGVFGSHVGNVLRRLRRLARIYGAEPQFLLASATVSNPGELAQSLLGVPVTVVGDDAAARAERTVVLWNPPLLDDELGVRASALAEAARLQAMLVDRGLRTLTFAKSRKAAELIHRFTAERLGDDTHLSPYRAGYTAAQRREIERKLAEGELLGVSATNALELGIDIGLLDAVISVGFPGTVASLRQQWGRAGRRGSGLAVMIATEDGLDQFFMREPDKLLGRRVEAAILDHANPRVLTGHVRAAAYEAPITGDDADTLGPEAIHSARNDHELKDSPAGIVWGGRDHPAARIGLRSTDPDAFTIVDATTGNVLGLVERSRAYSTVHEGAIYLHLGESYLVHELDLTTLHAVVEPFSGSWYTQAKKETMTQIVEPRRVEWRMGMELTFGEIEVTEQVVGYERKTISGQERLEVVPLLLPATSFNTEAVWYLPEAFHLAELEEMPKLLGTLHAAEHAMIALLPLWAMCDRWDIGGLSTNIHPQTGRPTVFIYDGHAGGVGITERGFEQFEGWVRDTAALLRGCPCHDGCPSCVQSPKCGNLNDMLDKGGALTFLQRLVDFGGARSS
jgi:DEAD/DEAH box helicase domain-containing protein